MNIVNFTWPDKTKLSKGAFEIVKKLRKAGFEALIAGGAVRDAILKRKIEEIDIATSATPNQVKKVFAKTIPTGEKHGTITVRLNSTNYEVTTFRREGKYLDYRRPSKVNFVKNAEEDAKRRDFTVNALFYDPAAKEIVDYVDGIADLYHQNIGFIGKPEDRIKEDALRMLRAVRIATVLQFELERETRKTIQKNAKLIAKISAERIKQELDLIMLSARASVGMGLLDIVGLLEHLLPEIKNMQRVGQPKNQHSEGDVYAHTMLALEKMDESYDLSTRYGVLFHDLGKPVTKEIRNGRITFYNHQNVGAEMVRKLGLRLKFSRAEIEKIGFLVKNHMVPFDFVRMKLSTRRKWGLSPHFQDLLKVYLADVRASIPASGKPHLDPRGYREGLKILKEIKAKPKLAKPILSGYEVMKILKIPSGPQVGKVLYEIEELKLAGKLKTKKEAIEHLRTYNK